MYFSEIIHSIDTVVVFLNYFKVIIFISLAWSEYDIFRLRITYLVIG